MPLFEYLCESCGRTLEAIQGVGEAPLSLCDRCGGPLRKLLSAPAFSFKGTGWYATDYGKTGPAAPTGSDAPAADTGKTEGSTPTDASKEASKADPPKKDAKKDS